MTYIRDVIKKEKPHVLLYESEADKAQWFAALTAVKTGM
jgi:hypothetical protein